MTADPTPTPEQPRTPEGRTMLEVLGSSPEDAEFFRKKILAIEAQARPEQDEAVRLLLDAWERVEPFIEVRHTTTEAARAWEAWNDALLATPPPATPCTAVEPHPECRYGNGGGSRVRGERWRCYLATPPPATPAALDEGLLAEVMLERGLPMQHVHGVIDAYRTRLTTPEASDAPE